jgi:hypothetical protein
MSATGIQSGGGPSVTIANGTAASQITAAYDTAFRQRVYAIAPLVAIAVVYEDPAVQPAHAGRMNYAKVVLADPVGVTNRTLCFALVADGVTNSGSTDQAIANRLGDLWGTLSLGY